MKNFQATTSVVMLLFLMYTTTLFASETSFGNNPKRKLGKIDRGSTTSNTIGEIQRLELLAGTENEQASIELAKTSEAFAFGFKFTAPTDKGDKSSKLANLDGLADSIRGEVRVTYSPWRLPGGKERQKNSLALCRKMAAVYLRDDPDSYGEEHCDSDLFAMSDEQKNFLRSKSLTAEQIAEIEVNAEKRGREWEDNLLGNKPMLFFSALATVGTEDFEYLDELSFVEKDSDEIEWSVELAASMFLIKSEWFFSLAVRHEETYESSKKEVRCPAGVGAGIVVCQSNIFALPKRKNKEILTLEVKKSLLNLGFAPKVAYDFEDKIFGVEVPIYLIRNDKGAFTGGVKLGWRDDDDDLIASIFVGTPFQIFE